MTWRNDPATLAMFYHRTPKLWESFWPEYLSQYLSEETFNPLFALENGRRMAFLRFGRVTHPLGLPALTVDISINIAPDSRGKGLGRRVLAACLEHLRRKGVAHVYAEILVKNAASIRAFSGAGFRTLGIKDKLIADTGETHRVEMFLADTGLDRSAPHRSDILAP
jgi:L-amino acid N-acyltransferase YncA